MPFISYTTFDILHSNLPHRVSLQIVSPILPDVFYAAKIIPTSILRLFVSFLHSWYHLFVMHRLLGITTSTPRRSGTASSVGRHCRVFLMHVLFHVSSQPTSVLIMHSAGRSRGDVPDMNFVTTLLTIMFVPVCLELLLDLRYICVETPVKGIMRVLCV